MIYTVTFNPALDYVMNVGEIQKGKTNRSLNEEITIGGKGINVSIVLKRLNVENIAFGFIAGFTGCELNKRAIEYGISTDFINLSSGNTRINLKLKGEVETEINAKGPDINQDELNLFFKKLEKIKSGDSLVLSGSVPESLPKDIYARILSKISDRNIKFYVDSTGELLIETLKYKPFLIKPNKAELEEIIGKSLNSLEEIKDSAKKLQKAGAKNVLVSLGEMGAVLLDENKKFYYEKAKKIKSVNTVGAGDSMIAGFICGIDKGYDYALKLSVAAGSATACSFSLATKEEILKLL